MFRFGKKTKVTYSRLDLKFVFSILLILTTLVPLAQARDTNTSSFATVEPRIWQPTADSRIRFIIPALSTESSLAAFTNYLESIADVPDIEQIFPLQAWRQSYDPRLIFSSLSPNQIKPRALFVAGRSGDHALTRPRIITNGPQDRIHRVLPRFANFPNGRIGFENYILPFGALDRLTESQKWAFFKSLDQYFSLLVHLGGPDIAPEAYGETPRLEHGAVNFNFRIDQFEIEIFRGALEHSQINILGICRGSQLMNVALGGKLYQDIYYDLGMHRKHAEQSRHGICILTPNSPEVLTNVRAPTDGPNLLFELTGLSPETNRPIFLIPSEHHQANRHESLPSLIQPLAISLGKYPHLEAYEIRYGSFAFSDESIRRVIVGLQGHPERTTSGPSGQMIPNMYNRCVRQLSSRY